MYRVYVGCLLYAFFCISNPIVLDTSLEQTKLYVYASRFCRAAQYMVSAELQGSLVPRQFSLGLTG